MSVGPAGMISGFHFMAPVVALAMAVWAGGVSHAEVRRRMSPDIFVGATAQPRWNSLRRWARAAGRGELWPSIRVPADWTRREVARRVTLILAGRGPPGETELTRIFVGAAHLR